MKRLQIITYSVHEYAKKTIIVSTICAISIVLVCMNNFTTFSHLVMQPGTYLTHVLALQHRNRTKIFDLRKDKLVQSPPGDRQRNALLAIRRLVQRHLLQTHAAVILVAVGYHPAGLRLAGGYQSQEESAGNVCTRLSAELLDRSNGSEKAWRLSELFLPNL